MLLRERKHARLEIVLCEHLDPAHRILRQRIRFDDEIKKAPLGKRVPYSPLPGREDYASERSGG